MRLAVVGNPDNRRVGAFAGAVRSAGLPAPRIVSWRQVLTADPAEPRLLPGTLVRIESPGEDAEVDRLLRGADRPAAVGEVAGGRAWHAGFSQALDRVAAIAVRDGATLLNSPRDIKIMFDKAACHGVLSAAGVPVPPALPAEVWTGWVRLRQAMRDAGWRRVFVKPRHGSSASGVIALAVGPVGQLQAVTSVELVRGEPVRLFNSLRVRTYRDERDIAAIVDALAPDGLHVERWFPKAGLHGRTIDLRVVVIAGRASHVVVRGGAGPMTNLHLGGVRGDLAALREAAGPAAYVAALDSCERAAACFPGSLHVGVDLMFAPDFRQHAIAEVNAFGDLLPGLLVDGRDSYAAEIAALAGGWRPAGPKPAPLLDEPVELDMNDVVGSHDILFVTLDTLRYDVAAQSAADGRTPCLSSVLPGGQWERRHTPASFTYAAHHAFFAGFLPTPTGPAQSDSRAHRRLFAAAFPGSVSTGDGTWEFDAPDVVSGLRAAGYHTACVGGVGFFNRRSALGAVLPGLFDDAYWEPSFGVTDPDSTRHQVDRIARIVAGTPPERPLFVFLNVSALHQPNAHHLPGATADSRDSHAAALAYVDGQLPRLFALMASRGRPCLVIICSDHGTAYGEDGHVGHRIGHDVVWTVPYAHFTLPAVSG